MAIQQAIAFYAGEDITVNDTITQPGTTTPQDITGWTLLCVVRASQDETSPVLISKTTGVGITITSPTLGQFAIALTASDTGALTPGPYYWGVARTNAGSKAVLTTGQLTVQPSPVLP